MKKWQKIILLALATSQLSACGTLFAGYHQEEPVCPYNGTYSNLKYFQMLAEDPSEKIGWILLPFQLVDTVASLAGDTLVLPYTLSHVSTCAYNYEHVRFQ